MERSVGEQRGDGDLRPVVAFSVLFVVPALSIALVAALASSDVLGRGPFLFWMVLPGLISGSIALWASLRSGVQKSTAWGFSISAALIAVIFAFFALAAVIGVSVGH
jgi:hypothetical protein